MSPGGGAGNNQDESTDPDLDFNPFATKSKVAFTPREPQPTSPRHQSTALSASDSKKYDAAHPDVEDEMRKSRAKPNNYEFDDGYAEQSSQHFQHQDH